VKAEEQPPLKTLGKTLGGLVKLNQNLLKTTYAYEAV